VNLNPNVYPHDGFFFRESDGVRIYADSWAGVVARVIKYRKRAGLPAGNPEEEVSEQACKASPVLCTGDDKRHAAAIKVTPLKARVLSWLNNRQKEKKELSFVEEPTARERAAICATCDKNQSLPSGCASCNAARKIMREEIIGKRFQDGRVDVCAVLAEDLKTSVTLESQTVENNELPGKCWRKRTI
jgi:hypothetical protein